MKLAERVDILEHTLMEHLKESGEIRSDLKWLKKSFWTLTTLLATSVVALACAWIRSH